MILRKKAYWQCLIPVVASGTIDEFYDPFALGNLSALNVVYSLSDCSECLPTPMGMQTLALSFVSIVQIATLPRLLRDI